MIEDITLQNNPIHLFIDASNLWEAQKSKGRFLDYQKIVRYVKEKYKGTSIKVFYYSAYPASGTRAYSITSKHDFYTFLKRGLGFEVRKKKLKQIEVILENKKGIKEKGNMDVEIAMDAILFLKNFMTAVFFSGDSDFLPLVTYIKNQNKKVYIFSSKNNVSEELRTGGDGYVDVLKIDKDIWGRELRRRGAAISS